jgi:hypothetical protein
MISVSRLVDSEFLRHQVSLLPDLYDHLIMFSSTLARDFIYAHYRRRGIYKRNDGGEGRVRGSEVKEAK